MTSKPFSMPSKKMLTALYLEYGSVWTIIAVIGIVTFVVLGVTVNLKFLILALIWVFLFWPLMVAFLYFFYGMRPLTAFNSISHTVSFSPEEVTVQIHEEDPENSEPGKEFKVAATRFQKVKTGADAMILFFGDEGWLWIPLSAFDSIDDFKKILQMLNPSSN